jgi:hypothetical protein
MIENAMMLSQEVKRGRAKKVPQTIQYVALFLKEPQDCGHPEHFIPYIVVPSADSPPFLALPPHAVFAEIPEGFSCPESASYTSAHK